MLPFEVVVAGVHLHDLLPSAEPDSPPLDVKTNGVDHLAELFEEEPVTLQTAVLVEVADLRLGEVVGEDVELPQRFEHLAEADGLLADGVPNSALEHLPYRLFDAAIGTV